MAPITVNPFLAEYQRDSYTATNGSREEPLVDQESVVDCALGVNPYGAPPHVALPHAVDQVGVYPDQAEEFRLALAEHWAPVDSLMPANFQPEAGTFGVIERLGKLLVEPGSRVLGYAPQFSDFEHEMVQRGARYEHIPLSPGSNYRFCSAELIAAIRPDHRLVYVDNPNNPTGQVIARAEIEAVVAAAAELRVAVLIDEAYGDFMPAENSAVGLVNGYDNLLVARSFSKAWGLPGLRVGYAAMSSALVPQWSKVNSPFPVNSVGQGAARQALLGTDFLATCVERVREHKALLTSNCVGFRVLETHPTVPILTLVHPDGQLDLHRELLRRHVVSSSGAHFTGLNRNSVRIRIPRDIERLVAAVRDIGLPVESRKS